MSDREKSQSKYEKKWAQAFLDRINLENKSDYTIDGITKQPDSWADVDVSATSPSGHFPPLYLQLTRDDRLDTVFVNGKYRTPVFNCDNIITAISDKVKKYSKSGKDFSNISLLVQGTLDDSSIPFEINNSLRAECAQNSFKEIYYLSAPRLSNSGGINHFEDWTVIKLKPLN